MSTLPSRREAEAAAQAEIVAPKVEVSDGGPCHHCGDKFSTMRCPRCRRRTCKPMLHDCMATHRCGGEG